MKILTLRFQNLNSLVGEWEIDFTQPAFTQEGIFAITGPTGSGKTTILDAISLALYGCTPRLDKITVGSNEIMSQHTGECFAELVFSTSEGVYCCHWSQHRARRSAAGDLQNAKHEISDIETGKVLENKLRSVPLKVEQLTGMNFERFTRSMLLAQGAFATFLQASADERAPILEHITGTEIYSQISMLVHEKNRQEQDKLTALENQVSHISLLTNEQEHELSAQLKQQKTQQQALQQQIDKQQQAITWLHNIQQLKQQLTLLEQEKQLNQQAIKAFEKDEQRLLLALKVAEHEAQYAQLKTARRQHQEWQRQVNLIEQRLPQLLQQEAQQQQNKLTLQQQHQELLRYQEEMKPIFKQVAAWDMQIDYLQTQSKEQTKQCLQSQQAIAGRQQLYQQTEKKQQKTTQILEQHQQYLLQHSADAAIAERLAVLQHHAKNLKPLHQSLQQQQQQQSQLQQQLQASNTKLEQLKQNKQQAELLLKQSVEQEQALKQQQQSILQGRLIRELHQQKEALLREQALLKRVQSLEHERQQLHDGKPCPLCGSSEHPYAQGQIPALDEVDHKVNVLNQQIEQHEALTTALATQQQQSILAADKSMAAEKAVFEAQTQHGLLQQQLQQLTSITKQQQSQFEQDKQLLLDQARPFFTEQLNLASVSDALQQLEQRAKAWQQAEQQVSQWQTKAQQLNSKLSEIKEAETIYRDLLTQQETELQATKKQLQQLQQQRLDSFGDTPLKVAEQQLAEQQAKLNKQIELAQTAWQQSAKALQHSETQLESAKQELQKTGNLQQQAEQEFQQLLKQLAMPDEACFVAASLTAEQRQQLAKQQSTLQQEKLKLSTQQEDREKQLQQQQSLALSQESEAVLSEQLAQTKLKLETLTQSSASIGFQLQQNQQNMQQLATQRQAIEKQSREAKKWQQLHQLIGSADGKKYRNFAQGLSFELLIAYANQQLEKMSDRYLLVHDRERVLELSVIDNYQAGELRSTKNLSGGESFIISLALALGLSQMASQSIRVDSLFLDEGFGTLDEDALEVALDTLASLQHDGKLIGVISHVPALKERLATQIKVQPSSSGKSRLVLPY